MTKTALVLGAGGFIGSHMVKRLRKEGYWVRGVDLKYPEYSATEANEFVKGDLRDTNLVNKIIKGEEIKVAKDIFSTPISSICSAEVSSASLISFSAIVCAPTNKSIFV